MSQIDPPGQAASFSMKTHPGGVAPYVDAPSPPAILRTTRRFSRHQRATITRAILVFVFTLALCQLWLFTATLNAYLGGDNRVVWPGAIASLACLGLNIGLLRYLYFLEEPTAPSRQS